MKYRNIVAIREYIRSLREQNVPWSNICMAANILTEDGRPNTKLAQDIGYKVVKVHGIEQPYQPHDPNVRERLGLRPVCSECGRPPVRKSKGVREKRVNYKHLLMNVAMPALDEIVHSNNLSGRTRKEIARECLSILKRSMR